MPRFWRWFFVILLAAGYVLFLILNDLQQHIELGTQQLTANAQSHAGVLGIFAGFIAAIVVIVLTRDDSQISEQRELIRLGAVGTFLCAFLHAILGSFQYASYSGFTEYWQSLPHDKLEVANKLVFPNYIFNLLGAEYLLAVYLCFFGLVLVIRYLTNREELVILSHFLLFTVYLLGSAWVFMDFASGQLKDAEQFNFVLLGAFYIGIVTIASAWPVGRPRLSHQTVLRLLYCTLAFSIMAAIVSGIWYAGICYQKPENVSVAQVSQWAITTVKIITIVGGILFAFLSFCLNRLTSATTDSAGQEIPSSTAALR